MDAMLSWIEHALRVLQQLPVPVWAIIAGTVLSWGVTQRAKFLIPFHASPMRRHYTAQLMAFLVGLVATAVLWRPLSLDGVVAGLAVGLWSPWSYWLFMRIIAARFPAARARLSQDVRP